VWWETIASNDCLISR